MRRTFRTILVGVLVLSMTVDSATACRYLARRCYRPCPPVCYVPCYPTCYQPCYMSSAGMTCQPPCEPCYAEVIEAPSMPSEEPFTAPQEPSSHAMPTPATVNKRSQLEMPPSAAPELMPSPGSAEAMPPGDQSDQWRATDEVPQLPAQPDNMFGAPPAGSAMPSDGLFGEPAHTEPAPMATTPAPTATEPAPAATEPAPAATPPAASPNDLFGPLPGIEPTPPAEPGHEMSGPSMSEPAEQPSTDLFGPTDSTAPADNLFGPMGDGAGAPADDGASNMEGTPDEPRADKAAPADEAAPPADNEKDEVDDLFGGFGAILREPGGLASGEMREWVDNSGRYACRGRLLQFRDGQVRLLKDNGRTTTVPVHRLSQGDLEFVERQASAQRADVFSRTADNTQPQPVN